MVWRLLGFGGFQSDFRMIFYLGFLSEREYNKTSMVKKHVHSLYLVYKNSLTFGFIMLCSRAGWLSGKQVNCFDGS